jgi:hypothetical protein
MGAGGGNGPSQRYERHCDRRSAQATCQGGGVQERHQPQLRHEHADDVQRLRHVDVAERSLTPRVH